MSTRAQFYLNGTALLFGNIPQKSFHAVRFLLVREMRPGSSVYNLGDEY